jgi:hypothetical protein
MRRMLLSLMSVAAMAVPGSHARAMHNGAVCHPIAEDIAKVSYSQFGVQNTSSTAEATVWCPIDRRVPPPDDPEVGTTLMLRLRDQNSSIDFSCTLFTLDIAGNTIFSAPPTQIAQTRLFWESIGEQNNMVIQCSIPRVQSGAASHITLIQWVIT